MNDDVGEATWAGAWRVGRVVDRAFGPPSGEIFQVGRLMRRDNVGTETTDKGLFVRMLDSGR